MKLLILTQKVDANDDLLGFFYDWIKEFAKHCEKLTVIALSVGKYEFPENVKILSLGKEEFSRYPRHSRWLRRLVVLLRFYKDILAGRNNYDEVLVHMNPEYVIAGGWFWKLSRKKIALWYVHKAVNLRLRLAAKLADIIFTASPESFCLPSKKIKIVGHGVDTGKFKNLFFLPKDDSIFRVLYAGRISKIKNQELSIKALDILVNRKNLKNIHLDLAGKPINKQDEKYLDKLKELCQKLSLENYVSFLDNLSFKKMPAVYSQSDLNLNLCPTGGMDKAVLEAMAAGIPVLALNQTFKGLLGDLEANLMLENERPEELAEKITEIINKKPEDRLKLGEKLRERVEKNYSLDRLIHKIIEGYG